MKVVATILFLLTTLTLSAQTKSLENYFAQIRTGKYPNVPAEVSKPEMAGAWLKALPAYLNDTLPLVRSKAAALVRTVGVKSAVSSVRAQAVQHSAHVGVLHQRAR
jgi:hypothetical protein